MTDETCKENAGKLTVPLPQRFALIHGLLNPQTNGTLCRYEDAIAYGDEMARAIAEDRNCWKSIADGEAELRAMADDELKVSEGRVAELESLLLMIATRAQTFPDFPIGWHIPEVFKAVGMEMPKRPDTDDTHDGLRARIAELEAKLKDSEDIQFAMLGLIADIRAAAGDPTGRLMQAELVELIGRQREECDQMRAAESAAIAAGGGDA